eukprot:7377764-Prymnesium_polylepis.2
MQPHGRRPNSARCLLLLSSLDVARSAIYGHLLCTTPTRCLPANSAARSQIISRFEVAASEEELFDVYRQERAKFEAKHERERHSIRGALTSALRPLIDKLAVRFMRPALRPHDIPVITLDRSQWSVEVAAEAIEALFSNRACAVHVQRFLDEGECRDVQDALANRSLFSNWQLHEGPQSEVDKTGSTSGEAMDSFESFQAYVHTAAAIDSLLPGKMSPFEILRRQL